MCHCKYRLSLYGCVNFGGVETVPVLETYCYNTVLEASLKKGSLLAPKRCVVLIILQHTRR